MNPKSRTEVTIFHTSGEVLKLTFDTLEEAEAYYCNLKAASRQLKYAGAEFKTIEDGEALEK